MRGRIHRSFGWRYIIRDDMDRWMDKEASCGGRRKCLNPFVFRVSLVCLISLVCCCTVVAPLYSHKYATKKM